MEIKYRNYKEQYLKSPFSAFFLFINLLSLGLDRHRNGQESSVQMGINGLLEPQYLFRLLLDTYLAHVEQKVSFIFH